MLPSHPLFTGRVSDRNKPGIVSQRFHNFGMSRAFSSKRELSGISRGSCLPHPGAIMRLAGNLPDPMDHARSTCLSSPAFMVSCSSAIARRSALAAYYPLHSGSSQRAQAGHRYASAPTSHFPLVMPFQTGRFRRLSGCNLNYVAKFPLFSGELALPGIRRLASAA